MVNVWSQRIKDNLRYKWITPIQACRPSCRDLTLYVWNRKVCHWNESYRAVFFFSTSKMTISLPSINEPCDGSFKLLSQCFHVLLTVDWFRIRKNLVSTETYKALQELNPWTSIRSCFCFIELWDQRDQNRNLLVSAAVVFFSDWEHKVDKCWKE